MDVELCAVDSGQSREKMGKSLGTRRGEVIYFT
jgi:hypothetical protein